ncbi:MAG: hypothetical protein V1652_00655 [bacterium]
MNKRRLAILYSDAKREYFPTEEQYLTEAEVFERAKVVERYFQEFNFETRLLPGNDTLMVELQKFNPDLTLNLVDSISGEERLAAIIPAILELLKLPYLGTGMLGLSINSNKFLTKKILEQAALPLPLYQLFDTPNDPLDKHLKFPLISKLNEVHGSVEITNDSISENESHLRKRLKDLITVYKQPVLVEEFIVGRELTAYVLEGAVKKIYIGEKIFNETGEKYKLATFDAVWRDIDSYGYSRYKDNGILEDYVRDAFDVLKMSDYAKFDLRLDESGRYYFIDCNANPAFGPMESDCAIGLVLDLYNINFKEVIRRLAINAEKESCIDLKYQCNRQ